MRCSFGGEGMHFLVFFVLGIIREKGDGEMDVRRMICFECGVSNKKNEKWAISNRNRDRDRNRSFNAWSCIVLVWGRGRVLGISGRRVSRWGCQSRAVEIVGAVELAKRSHVH